MTAPVPSDRPVLLALSHARQLELLDAIVAGLAAAPLFRPTMPRWGTPFSVQISNCGPLGWVSDKSGYRYQPCHPVTGRPWPPIPTPLLDLWDRLSLYPAPPEACLVNYYAAGARMGLHQDRDEEDFGAPVLSVSLGDTARFRLGGTRRTDASSTFDLASGDVMMLAGPTRLAFHGIDRTASGSSPLLGRYPEQFPGGGRLNLTLRRVHAATGL
ncbi:alpha-ketoglutarate-dependent dioxygenase AlkB [Devosia sp.]|uniref:alpha-ketoglutarate-dependent dioxygenase AlkB n=1 Tax=Devosia sp. TaxID=1871048 RepID=UPI0035B3AC4C